MSLFLAAQTADTQQGWGRLAGLVVAGLVFWAGTVAHTRWKTTRDPASPTTNPAPMAVKAVKAQVTVDRDSAGSVKTVAVRPGGPPASTRPTLDDWVAARVGRVAASQIVRDARRVFGASESSVYRAMRRTKAGDTK